MKQIILIMSSFCFLLMATASAVAIHKTEPAESGITSTTAPLIAPEQTAYVSTLNALISLLEKKGYITQPELKNEIERLRKSQ